MIPKKLHFVWVGSKCWSHPTPLGLAKREDKHPDEIIETWRKMHPSWDIRVWGNADLESRDWRLKNQMLWLYSGYNYGGVADLMRYEILHEHGGVYIDADTVCLQPIDDLLDCELFGVKQRERNTISNAFVGTIAGHPLFGWMIEHLLERGDDPLSWRGKQGSTPTAIGPLFFTYAIEQTKPDITVLPFYTFMPNDPFTDYHHIPDEGQKIYGDHLWYSYLGTKEEAEAQMRETLVTK